MQGIIQTVFRFNANRTTLSCYKLHLDVHNCSGNALRCEINVNVKETI